MNSTVKDQMKWCFGICCSLCVKNLRLVNFISSLYTAPVQVDDCYRTITSQRFEHTYSLSLMSLISEITQTHSLPDFQVVPNTTKIGWKYNFFNILPLDGIIVWSKKNKCTHYTLCDFLKNLSTMTSQNQQTGFNFWKLKYTFPTCKMD